MSATRAHAPPSSLPLARSAFTERSYEFAAYLYLVILFPDSFVPAAVLGLLTTSTSLLLSGWVGGLVDVKPRLAVVRVAIGVQKIAVGLSYALFVGQWLAGLETRPLAKPAT